MLPLLVDGSVHDVDVIERLPQLCVWVGGWVCECDGDASVHVRGEACVHVHYYAHVDTCI